jgi:hypothetical protein
MFLILKYERIRSWKEGHGGTGWGVTLVFLYQDNVLFFHRKIFLWVAIFKLLEISGFPTVCYFLKLLHISVVIKCEINIPTTFLQNTWLQYRIIVVWVDNKNKWFQQLTYVRSRKTLEQKFLVIWTQ